jgi:uncharacterized protein (DUF2267 family)
MDQREFIRKVAERSQLSKEESADLTRAVLDALGQRLSAGEVRDLVLQLPDPLAEAIHPKSKSPERFDLTELIDRVSKRTGLNETETTVGVRAVLTTLRDAIDERVFNQVMSQLPSGFSKLAQPL